MSRGEPAVARLMMALCCLVTAAGAASGCAGDDDQVATSAPAPTRTAGVPKADRDWCGGRRESLTCIADGSGLRGIVYLGASTSSNLILWDPGGPGLGLPDADTNLVEVVPKAIRDRNVLLVVEPWVRVGLPDSCLRSSFTGDPDATCDLENLATSSQDVQETIELAETQTNLVVDGAYLQSFGASRSLPAIVKPRKPGMRWAVLVSPGPPPGEDASVFMAARKRMMLKLLSSRCGDDMCRDRIRNAVDRFSRAGGPDTTGREFALGLIALATLPQENKQLMDRISRQLGTGVITEESAADLRLLGRLYEGKRPGKTVSPSLIGLWADTCPRLTGWDRLARTSDPILKAYSWTFRACRDISKGDVEFRVTGQSTLSVLMLSGVEDAVVPPQEQAKWTTRGLTPERIYGKEHQWESSRVTGMVRSWIDRQ